MSKYDKLIKRYCQIPGRPPANTLKTAIRRMNAKERGQAFATMKRAIAQAEELNVFPDKYGRIPGIELPPMPFEERLRRGYTTKKII